MSASCLPEQRQCNHIVQFYSEDNFLLDELCTFIAVALADGNAAIVIATRSHCDQLTRRLRANGCDTDAALECGRFVVLDTTETLSKFMVNGLPEAQRFFQVVGEVVAKATAAAEGVHPHVVAFGEMVAELWAERNGDAAISLEQLWNQLAEKYAFTLRCAYPLSGFNRVEDAEPLMKICAEHSAVIPGESFTILRNEDDRVRAITQLQQKAHALETEMAERLRMQKELLASQEALQRSHDELEKKVHERTRELVSVKDALRRLSRRLLNMRDQERRSLGLELHDSTSQILAALQINLATLEQTESHSDPRRAARLLETFQLADRAMREVRRLSYALHPPLLEEPGLQFALGWYVAGFSQQTEIDVQLDIPRDMQRLSHEMELAVFRIVEDALDNVYRHSGSKTAQVRLAIENEFLHLGIDDAGRGMGSGETRNGAQGQFFRFGAGITGMIERAEQFGGEFVMAPAHPGTSVRIRLPLYPGKDTPERDQAVRNRLQTQ